jgi:hypothetical protein
VAPDTARTPAARAAAVAAPMDAALRMRLLRGRSGSPAYARLPAERT